MRVPQFITLARVDQERFVSACPRGIVHLSWGCATVRLSHGQLRRLAIVLDRNAGSQDPVSGCDGELAIALRPDGQTQVQIAFPAASRREGSTASVVLVLAPEELALLHQALREAVQRLDQLLASGVWSQEGAESEPPDGASGQLGRFPFSDN